MSAPLEGQAARRLGLQVLVLCQWPCLHTVIEHNSKGNGLVYGTVTEQQTQEMPQALPTISCAPRNHFLACCPLPHLTCSPSPI